ncbi:MAG: TonB-dependent receptor plug domain-containing protein [Hyphomonadaceae bacterium]
MRTMLATTLVLICFATPASAQEEVLVVTATRTPTPAARLPADITIIDAGAERGRGVFTLADALAEAEGLDVVRSGGIGQQTSLFAGGANSNHTLVLFDGLRLNDPSTPGSSFDAGQDTLGALERIEVVQGPMSALFGSDAIGGVVNLLPRRGGEGALNTHLEFGVGSFGMLTGFAGADGTLGRLRYAVSAEGFAMDGDDIVPARMATHTGEADRASAGTLTGVFDLDVTETLALDLLLRRREAQADFDAFIFVPPTFAEQRVDDPDLEIARNDFSVARLGATWRLSENASVRATGGALRQEREERDGGFITSSFEGDRDFADLALDWRVGGAALNAGIATQTESVDVDQGFATVVEQQDHRAAFLTAQYDIGALTLTGAVRADNYEGFGTATTWRLGASFMLSEHTRFYAAYGTSFRAPTLYERFVSFGDPNLDAEGGKAWELGADARFAAFGQDNGFEAALIYRRLEITDLIDFGPAFTYANVDEAEIDSAEARLALRPLDWLTARVSYVWTDARDGVTDAPLLRRPEHSWSASLTVERGPFEGRVSWRQVGGRADQIYGDDGFGLGVGETPAYDVVRASAGWDVNEHAQIFAAVENVADEAYEPANGFAGAERNLSVGLRLRR